MATVWAHFRISEELRDKAKLAAAADRRSLSNWFALTVERALDEPAPEPPVQVVHEAIVPLEGGKMP